MHPVQLFKTLSQFLITVLNTFKFIDLFSSSYGMAENSKYLANKLENVLLQNLFDSICEYQG